VFLGLIKQVHWDFSNPSSFSGAEEEIVDKLRLIRDSIHDQIISWCDEISEEDELL
jgi:hypothetical protein